jgi:hypothetical protein
MRILLPRSLITTAMAVAFAATVTHAQCGAMQACPALNWETRRVLGRA